jgi:hypothetical protein
MRAIWLAEQQLASQEGLPSVEVGKELGNMLDSYCSFGK